jgi:phytoene synthase
MSVELIRASQQSIAKGSKSFAMASLFFDPLTKQAAWHLYSWCRYCDDQIDQAQNKTEALLRLQDLRAHTSQAFRSRSGNSSVFEALSIVAHEYKIPEKYALDLLRGMEMDVQGRTYSSLEDLLDYAYCVAGTVGLMMCPVMGLTDPAALKNAVHMGIAMQLTNIARDVDDDLKLGRIYFPEKWLHGHDIKAEDFAKVDRRVWASLARQLVKEAQFHYELGYLGLRSLPWRAAWAVFIAAQIYSRIGNKVVARRERAWDKRCFVSAMEKILIAIFGSFVFFGKMFYFFNLDRMKKVVR